MKSGTVRVLLLRTAGTNCDQELALAFKRAGAAVELVHVNRLLAEPGQLAEFQILGIPGGFSYGDDIASGKILANQLRHHLRAPLEQFVRDDKMILGVCNGFQVLVKAGLLPGSMPQLDPDDVFTTTLTYNAQARFEDRWITLQSQSSLCKWIEPSHRLLLPVAHGEGRFVVRDQAVMRALTTNDQIVFRYVTAAGLPAVDFPDNPNGSVEAIAGICDMTGRILGLMPHPERSSDTLQHPFWTRLNGKGTPDGLQLFENAIKYIHTAMAVEV
ncbi:MAG: phosphoribosylformylglycinamidine synthase I [Phycisphaerae bacterium]